MLDFGPLELKVKERGFKVPLFKRGFRGIFIDSFEIPPGPPFIKWGQFIVKLAPMPARGGGRLGGKEAVHLGHDRISKG